MHSWPTDTRTKTATRKHTPPRNYPFIQQGTLNALTLLHTNGRFSWASLVNISPKENGRFRTGLPVPVFPATKPPAVNLPRVTVNRRAEQGGYVAEDAELANNLKSFDPYIGNALEVIRTYEDKTEQSGYLAFPMGETRTELNLSPFTVSVSEGTKVEPSTSPVRSFQTPIRQIVSSGGAMADIPLIVRTYGAVDVLQVRCDETAISIDNLASFTSSDLGNYTVVDMKLQMSPVSLLLVNDHGSIYNFDFGQQSLTRVSLDYENDKNHVAPDSFWRIETGKGPGECFLISGKTAWSVDTRANSRVELFNLPDSKDMLTSVDNSIDHNVLLCSTNELVWIDRRYPCRPMLGYKHYREFDRYLTAQTINFTSPLTFLSSRKNGLVSVYDVSYGQDRLFHVNTAPYALSPVGQTDKLHIGQVFLPQLGVRKGSELGLLRLGELGDIFYVELSTPDAKPEPSFELLKSQAYEVLEANAKELYLDLGPLSDQQGIVVDLSVPYDYIFRVHEDEATRKGENGADDVFDLLDLLSDSLRNADQPMEQMLTTYDIAHRAGEEPDPRHRTDFFTGSVLSSKRGYHAIKRGRLPLENMATQAPWHHNITPFLRRIDPETAGNVDELDKYLKEYNLIENEGRSTESLMHERRAREQLISDLILSRDIFAPHPFVRNAETDGILEAMAEALSLADELPAVDFGYLRPTIKETDYYQKKELDEREEKFTVGVRSLLKDWVAGSNPDAYVYHDSYEDETSALPPAQKPQPRAITHAVRSQPPPIVLTQSQKPPVIIASSTTEDIVINKTIPVAQAATTQLADWQQRDDYGSSQEVMMVSTQVLPGPHGGRPGVSVKKKIPKKRLGGF
ncbi:hypothetical protein BDQ17DRAFT_1341711 [Cyathus striatus]|nr:hypothetical protein BDQ17DRAFT_1341711 [Cyathus striatus]